MISDNISHSTVTKGSSEAGFTMIEILVALVILTIALLGLAGLQITSLQGGNNAYLRSQATLYTQDVIERMRANRIEAIAENYDITLAAGIPAATATVAEADINDWLRNISGMNPDGSVDATRTRGSLPGGDGSVDYDAGTQMVTVTVRWTDNYGGVSTTPQIQIVTRL